MLIVFLRYIKEILKRVLARAVFEQKVEGSKRMFAEGA